MFKATRDARSDHRRLWWLDPSGDSIAPEGCTALSWSPVTAAATWDGALLMAVAMATASPQARGNGDSHWTERAGTLLAPLLHAAALGGLGIADVHGWVLRQDLNVPGLLLEEHSATIANDILVGIAQTAEKERSGIFSTAAGILGAYNAEGPRRVAATPNFDAAEFVRGGHTIFIVAPAHMQRLTAPLVVGLLEEIRHATYERAAAIEAGREPRQFPVLFALDEAANIAPIHDLPAMVSEGGGQGVHLMACFQDLSQVREHGAPTSQTASSRCFRPRSSCRASETPRPSNRSPSPSANTTASSNRKAPAPTTSRARSQAPAPTEANTSSANASSSPARSPTSSRATSSCSRASNGRSSNSPPTTTSTLAGRGRSRPRPRQHQRATQLPALHASRAHRTSQRPLSAAKLMPRLCPPINHGAFNRPDAQAWYWIGFLGADGRVSDQGMVYLRLQERDRAHVEALRTFVGGGDEGRISGPSKSDRSYCLALTSRPIAADLLRLGGIAPRKTLTYDPGAQAASKAAFWLGMLDGDGTAGIYTFKQGKAIRPHLKWLGTKAAMTRCPAFWSAALPDRHFSAIVPLRKLWVMRCKAKPRSAPLASCWSRVPFSLDRKRVTVERIACFVNRRMRERGRRCTIEGCDQPYYARDLCGYHYGRMKATWMPPCAIDGCERPQTARGWCPMHYRRVLAHDAPGSPEPAIASLEQAATRGTTPRGKR